MPHFKAAFSAYENDSSFLNQMAFAEMGAQEFDSAISHYQRSLELRPDPVTHFHLGNAFQKLQNIPQAVVHFRTAMQMRPTWMLPANNLAWILATNRQHQDAKEAVKISESICREPTNRTPSALSTLAVAYAASSNFDKAISANQQAIKLAEQRGMVSLLEKLKNRSELFRNEQPYFE